MSNTKVRRYDVDWIRVISIGLLIVYHISIAFQPWGIFFQFIQNEESLEYVWIPMSMLNIWRIPILFFISGMGVFFAIRKRNWKLLIFERTRRILVPLLFGCFVITPIHIIILQKYYHQNIDYESGFKHLWFLANIFAYVLILSPFFFLLKRNFDSWVFSYSRKLIQLPFGMYFFVLPFILEVILVKPTSFSLYLFTAHGFWLGLLAFFFGFYFVAIGDVFWNNLAKTKFINLLLAFSLYMTRLIYFDFEAPLYLISIESLIWIFTLFGFAYSYLNHKSQLVIYLSKAAYPIYIIHMIFQYLASYFIMPLDINAEVKFLLILVLTFLGSFLLYEIFIRRIKIIRPLFGLNYLK